MKTTFKVQLNESEFRKIVKEELYIESVRQKLLAEGYEPEVIEELLGGALKNLAGQAWGGAKKMAGQAGKAVSDTAKEVGQQAKSAAGEVGKKAKEAKGKVVSAFQEQYRNALKNDLQKVTETLGKKYLNDKVLNRAGLNPESVRGAFDAAREMFWDTFIENLDPNMHQ